MSNVSDDHVKAVCRPGTSICCSFLTMHKGWTCAKEEGFEEIKILIDQKRAEGSIRAMGDNCSGPPNFVLATNKQNQE